MISDVSNGDTTTLLVVFLLATLATYRVSLLIAKDEGPWGIFYRIRSILGAYDLKVDGRPKTYSGRGIICPLCGGIYISLLLTMAIWPLGFHSLLIWMAMAGAQTFLIEQGRR